jgi:hypothetical protein
MSRLFHSFSAADACSLFALFTALLAHRFAVHFDTVGVVRQAVEDGLCQREISDLSLATGHWQLQVRIHGPIVHQVHLLWRENLATVNCFSCCGALFRRHLARHEARIAQQDHV